MTGPMFVALMGVGASALCYLTLFLTRRLMAKRDARAFLRVQMRKAVADAQRLQFRPPGRYLQGGMVRPVEVMLPTLPPPPRGGGGVHLSKASPFVDRRMSDADLAEVKAALKSGGRLQRTIYLGAGLTATPSDELPPDLPGLTPGYPTKPARREVSQEDGVWSVSGSDFTTTDRALAAAVACELDRVDPLEGP